MGAELRVQTTASPWSSMTKNRDAAIVVDNCILRIACQAFSDLACLLVGVSGEQAAVSNTRPAGFLAGFLCTKWLGKSCMCNLDKEATIFYTLVGVCSRC